jgi:hypothetical protein
MKVGLSRLSKNELDLRKLKKRNLAHGGAIRIEVSVAPLVFNWISPSGNLVKVSADHAITTVAPGTENIAPLTRASRNLTPRAPFGIG